MFGTNDLASLTGWGGGRVDAAGDYVWNLWRPYKCCRRRGQWFLFYYRLDRLSTMNAKSPYRFAHRRITAWLLIGLLGFNNAHAITKGPTEDSLWYYEIGGAEPVSAPANPSVVSVTLGGSAQLGLGYSCGKFDPVAAVTNTLNDIGAGVDNMMNAMTAAASAGHRRTAGADPATRQPRSLRPVPERPAAGRRDHAARHQVLRADGGRDRPGQESLCRSHHALQGQ